MPQSRLSVRKIREVLRLSATGLSARQIAPVVGIARSSVSECLRRAEAAGVTLSLLIASQLLTAAQERDALVNFRDTLEDMAAKCRNLSLSAETAIRDGYIRLNFGEPLRRAGALAPV